MNIFILDEDLDRSAEYHVDKHIIKMPLEAAQMLCTNMWIDKYLGYVPEKVSKEQLAVLREKKQNEPRDFPYLPTMHNHPCTIWARTSLDNHEWLHCYAVALNDEYGYRYGKAINQCMMSYSNYLSPYQFQEGASLLLLRQCQTSLKDKTQ